MTTVEQLTATGALEMEEGYLEYRRACYRAFYLDAGKDDEWFLDLGAQAFSSELEKLGVNHTLELFDGKHGGITYRYPGAIRELLIALDA